MKNALTTLRIQHFKSLKDVSLRPRRINLLIGQPNVGKSNVLEAISLLGAGFYQHSTRFLGDVLRYETVSNLFYDQDTSQLITVEADDNRAVLTADERRSGQYSFGQMTNELWIQYETGLREKRNSYADYPDNEAEVRRAFGRLITTQRDDRTLAKSVNELEQLGSTYQATHCAILEDGSQQSFEWRFSGSAAWAEVPKKYGFRAGQPHGENSSYGFLEPPLGGNLLRIVERNPGLRQEMAGLFRPYGLDLVLRVAERKFEIQKRVGELSYTTPYSLIADTLQRIIFYLAAIESNTGSVLLFEEPEAHMFPDYTARLGRKMVESETNQFFVATHSPYLLTQIIEEMVPRGQADALAVFVAYYEDYQTKLYQLTEAEVLEIRRDALDVFYNLNRYTPGPNPYA